MAYLQNFIRLSWGGTTFEDEIWTNNIHIATAVGEEAELTALLNDSTRLNAVTDLIKAHHASTAGSVAGILLDWTKFALIGTDGKYIGEARNNYFVGVNGGYVIDHAIGAYTSLAISFKSMVIKGPAANGRIYPPANASFADLFHADLQRRNDLAVAYAELLNDINDAINITGTNMEVSNVSSTGTGAQSPVRTVKVGDVMDVQRRRKNKLRENYFEVIL